MISYSYDNNGKYSGEYICQLDPLATQREGHHVYLLPADATWVSPPEHDPETEIPVWDGSAWTVEVLPEPEPDPEPEPTLDERVSALETTKADQTDVDELNEALDMILTGYTGEEAADETGA